MKNANDKAKSKTGKSQKAEISMERAKQQSEEEKESEEVETLDTLEEEDEGTGNYKTYHKVRPRNEYFAEVRLMSFDNLQSHKDRIEESKT